MFKFLKRKVYVYPAGVKKVNHYSWGHDEIHMAVLKENEIQHQISVNKVHSLQAALKHINLGNDQGIQTVTREIFDEQNKREKLRLENNRYVARLLGFKAETTSVDFINNTVMHYNSDSGY